MESAVAHIVISLSRSRAGGIQGERGRHLSAYVRGLGVEGRGPAPDGHARAGHGDQQVRLGKGSGKACLLCGRRARESRG